MKQMFFELAVREPGLVVWHCAVKPEMAVALTRALLTEQLRSADVPGQDAAKCKLASDLTARLGVDVDLDEAPIYNSSGAWTTTTLLSSGAKAV